jgi:hypothetical protein
MPRRSLRAVLATKTGRARDFGAGLKGLLQEARQRWHEARDGVMPACRPTAKAVQEARTEQRRARRRPDPDHPRRRTELGWHHDRGTVVRCLDAPRIEPTNKRAERARRPAVLARKVSPSSQHDGGAPALAAFTSVVRTLAKNGATSRVEELYPRFQSPNPQPFSPKPCPAITAPHQL